MHAFTYADAWSQPMQTPTALLLIDAGVKLPKLALLLRHLAFTHRLLRAADGAKGRGILRRQDRRTGTPSSS